MSVSAWWALRAEHPDVLPVGESRRSHREQERAGGETDGQRVTVVKGGEDEQGQSADRGQEA